ncbi:MAG: type II toxin-antitoxin system VapC family toxin [Methylococcaceae bacterium]|nr:type II toxin-antitoxin system VapC family toxin [Methylococcaceae bacterium]
MKFLLDTHILLWWLNDDEKLSEAARQLISNADNDIYISHISLWEIQIKTMVGKLNANLTDILQQLPENSFQQLPTHANHILALASLPAHHHDPFDRMLIAQAISEPLHLMTHDKQVALYSGSIILI